MENMIKIENLSKEYRLGIIGGGTLKETLHDIGGKLFDKNKRLESRINKNKKFLALNSVSFEIKKGERVGLIGKNGAGKSTLLKLISRITAPTSGAIYLNGKVSSMLEVGTGFHGELTGRENIYLNGAILGMTKKEIDQKIDKIIEFSEIAEFIDTPVKRYSSGMFVKLAFAVASHLDNEIMIMDEVLAVGDMAFQKKCIDKMNQVSIDEDRTIIYVSHNMETIRNLCTRCIVLDKGEVIFDGDTEKAISVYYETSKNDLQTKIDCENVKRSRYVSEKARILSIEFLDKSTCEFERNERIKIKVKWSLSDRINGLRFGVSIGQVNGLYGTSFSKEIEINENQEQQTTLYVDTSSLTKGIYNLSMFIFFKDKQGNIVLIDDLPCLCSFEITEKVVLDDTISNWGKRKFGQLHLKEIDID